MLVNYHRTFLFRLILQCLMQRKITMLVAIVVVAAALAIAPLLVNGAYAAISSTNTGCTNNGGGSPGGQQPTCTGSGLTQQTQNQNPAGSAPPGQNK
jgi:hypothetical protein